MELTMSRAFCYRNFSVKPFKFQHSPTTALHRMQLAVNLADNDPSFGNPMGMAVINPPHGHGNPGTSRHHA